MGKDEIRFVERDYSNISKKKIAHISSPFILLILFLMALIVYGGDVRKTLKFMFFSISACIVLVSFLFFPILNLFMFAWIRPYHNFILDLLGMKGDDLTLFIVYCIAVVYTILCYVVWGSTLIILIYNRAENRWEKIELRIEKIARKVIKPSLISIKRDKRK